MDESGNTAMQRNVQLLYEVGALRQLKRTWSQFLGADIANVAEHSFRVALIALMLAAIEGKGDSGRIAKLALIHDLAESRTGDVNMVQALYTRRDDAGALRDMVDGTALADELMALFEEYEARETLEAQLVKDADHLDCEFELGESTCRGGHIETALREDRDGQVFPRLFSEAARALWQARKEANAADWYTQGRNRFHPDR
ncbi:MAG: HD domain-containing protein [Ktedonobacterales bacterium]